MDKTLRPRHDIAKYLRRYFATLPREELEGYTKSLAHTLAGRMTLQELTDWLKWLKKV